MLINKRLLKPLVPLVLALGLSVVISLPTSYADLLDLRSVALSQDSPSTVANQNFGFTIPSTTNIGSIVLEYCSNTPIFTLPCTTPAGLNVASANLVSQTGNTGFTIDNADTTANELILSRPLSAGIATPSTYNFTNITNPSVAGTVFVRISTHTSLDGSGAFTDNGAVAYAIQNVFTVGSVVPPFLKLCVGITVAPDCSGFFGDSIDLGTLSSAHANFGQSQFATGTNDPTGYNIYALGTTMTSGNNIITSLSSLAPSFPGTSQFGINLRANTIPGIGQDPVGLGTGVPTANYNVPNQYIYNDGDNIASSPLNSDYNRMTVSYLVNVPSNQKPGIYSTTITYLALVQF